MLIFYFYIRKLLDKVANKTTKITGFVDICRDGRSKRSEPRFTPRQWSYCNPKSEKVVQIFSEMAQKSYYFLI